MKKYLPIILLVLGVGVVIGAVIFVKGREKDIVVDGEDTSAMIDVALEDTPVVSITPRPGGHWVDLKITNLKKFEAASFEYQLLFDVPVSGFQGESGEVKFSELDGGTYEKDILVGTQSSGNYYYYNNIEVGEFALKFRNDEGKLVARFETDFTFQTDTEEISSYDDKLKYRLEEPSEEFFITMNTFGIPHSVPGEISTDIYGVFTSSSEKLPGVVEIENAKSLYRFVDEKVDMEYLNGGEDMPDVGVFVGLGKLFEG